MGRTYYISPPENSRFPQVVCNKKTTGNVLTFRHNGIFVIRLPADKKNKMKKNLSFITLLLIFSLHKLNAQTLFTIPDTVCINQPVQIESHVTEASSYYWGFCSGYLENTPTGTAFGAGMGFNDPGAVEIVKDGDLYYGFVINKGGGNLLRLDFGTDLGNEPAITNLGTLNNSIPVDANALAIVKDSITGWSLLATGGNTPATASFFRADFGDDITRIPNSINFGNPGNIMSTPRGLIVEQDSSNWYAFLVDYSNHEFTRVGFGNNLHSTPAFTSFGNIGGLTGATDMALVKENNNWYMIITNGQSSTLSVVTTGNSLGNAPVGINIGNIDNALFTPSNIVMARDCGSFAAFITNQANDTLTRIDIPAMTGLYTASVLEIVADMSATSGFSRIMRIRDTLYAFATNGNSTLSRVLFPQCTDASIVSSTEAEPPVYTYSTPGTYNVYLAINEGSANMDIECHQIVVLPYPAANLTPGDTVLCQGDAIPYFIQSPRAINYTWSPDYNISDTTGMFVSVWPAYSTTYTIRITHDHGCVWDTSFHIEVSKVTADAGPSRYVTDGAKTVLGGPFTSESTGTFAYRWSPNTFLSDPNITNPVARPAYTITYYLQVTELNDTLGCIARDTVTVYVGCSELTLPNAFVPEGINGNNTFGLMNRQIVKLNYFRIYDRWGNLVFTTTDPAKQWDGKINSEYPPSGVFVWEADGFCISGERVHKQGNVTLLR